MATKFLYFISRSKVSANKVGVSIGKFLLYDPALGHLRMDRGHVLDDAGPGAYSQGLRVWWAATSARDGLAATLIYAYAAEYTILADVRDDVCGAAAAALKGEADSDDALVAEDGWFCIELARSDSAFVRRDVRLR